MVYATLPNAIKLFHIRSADGLEMWTPAPLANDTVMGFVDYSVRSKEHDIEQRTSRALSRVDAAA